MASHFYDEMYERMEDAADRAVFIRWRTTCPRMTDEFKDAFWLALIAKCGHAGARTRLGEFLDVHDRAVAAGGPGLFDATGDVPDRD